MEKHETRYLKTEAQVRRLANELWEESLGFIGRDELWEESLALRGRDELYAFEPTLGAISELLLCARGRQARDENTGMRWTMGFSFSL
ncbi:hypothetical protein K1719_015682 [Acacia pycnantha]|nr:hypothetical protein K1719_015682 [Acacia pycnantha]